MLENIDDEIEILYPIFCNFFHYVKEIKLDQILKEKFKKKIISALDYILQHRGKTYVVEEEKLEVHKEDPRPYQSFIFYLEKYGKFNYNILEDLFSYENAEGWVHVLNKLASKDLRPSSEKSIFSQRLNWKNHGQDYWDYNVEEEQRKCLEEDRRERIRRFLSEKNEIYDDGEEIDKYIKKQEEYSKRSIETIRLKIQQGKRLGIFDRSLPSLKDHRDQLIEECRKNPIGENIENIKTLQKYYYQGFELPKEEYLALIELNKLIKQQIPAWGPIDLQEDRVEVGVSIYQDSVKTLIIKNQQLTKFPECISNMKNLTFLDLSINFISNIPKSVKNLEKIVYIKLEMNNFTSYPFELLPLKETKLKETIECSFLNNPIENPYNFTSEDDYGFFGYLEQLYLIHIWTLNGLLGKIEKNEELNDGDLLFPNLLEYEKDIKDKCEEYKENSTAKEMLQLLEEKKVLTEIEQFIGEKLQLITYAISYKNNGYVVDKHHVVYLNLEGKNIDKLPSSIGKLKNLRFLSISNNNLKNLPITTSNFNEIKYIDIMNNNFSDLPLIFIEYKTDIGFEGNPWNDESLLYIKLWKEGNIKENFKEQLEKWTLDSLLGRISQNQPLRVIDRFQNDLCKFVDKILEQCVKTNTKTAQDIIKILEERCMIKIGKENYKIWK